MQAQQSAAYINLAFSLLVIVVVIVLRGRNVGKARPLKLERLWIIPALYAVVVGGILWAMPLHGLNWLWGALALVAGAAIGWWRGTSIRIHIDPETHAINQTSSWATIGLVAIFLLVRAAARFEVSESGFQPQKFVGVIVLFAFGLLTVMRLEMFLRAQRILRKHLAETFS